MKRALTTYTGLGLFILLSLLYDVSQASLLFSRNLTGSFDVSAISSESRAFILVDPLDTLRVDSTIKSESVDQDYILSWQKKLIGYFSTRASVRYFRFNTRVVSDESWRSDLVPNGELLFSHPDFVLNTTYRKRISRSNVETADASSERKSINLKTTTDKLPKFNVIYTEDENINDYDISLKEVKNKLFNASVRYEYKVHDLYYSFSKRKVKNIPDQFTSNTNYHTFRWNQLSYHKENRLRFTSSYLFTHSASRDVRAGTAGSYYPQATVNAFYGIDSSPEVATLDTLVALTDGNKTNPVIPLIEIGGINTDRNIGVELSYGVTLNAIFVYTDNVSANDVQWDIYTSNNNISWDKYNGLVVSEYNLFENRYEITFYNIAARYVKVVNTSINSADTVRVTEIEALQNYSSSRNFKRSSTSHLIDLGTNYKLTKKVELISDLSYRRQPSGSNGTTSHDLFLSLAGRHNTSEVITQILRLQAGYQTFGGDKSSLRNYTLGYTTLYDPYPTLHFIFSAFSVGNYDKTSTLMDNKNLYLQANGNVLPDLTFTSSISLGRNSQPVSDTYYDNWKYDIAIDGGLTRRIDFSVAYIHNNTKEKEKNSIAKDQISINLNYRLSKTIFLRGQFDYIDDEKTYMAQHYNISWNLSSRLSINGLYNSDERNDLETTEQYSLNSSLRIKSRALLYASIVENRLIEIGGSNTTSYQIGFKSGF